MTVAKDISLLKQVQNRIRFFNRRFFNPFALSFAGRAPSFWSVVVHVGRRSGKEYTTPVVTVRAAEGFVIPLPYGEHVDWLRNVLAAGDCKVITGGKVYLASQPEVVPLAARADAFPDWVMSLLHEADTESVLHLQRAVPDPAGKEEYRRLVADYPLWRGLLVLGLVAVALGGFLWRRAR